MNIVSLIKKLFPSKLKDFIKNKLLKMLSPERNLLIGMTTKYEQIWYSKISKKKFDGDGQIVDLGSWMGSTAISLAKGLKESASNQNNKIFAFDRFIWEPWMDAFMKELSCSYLPGEIFLPEVRKNIEPFKDRITLIKADLTKYKWENGPINILLVDAMKSTLLCSTIAKNFYPFLNVGSILIHQDFKHYFTTWIHILHYRLKSFFQFYHEVQESGTVSFITMKTLSFSDIENVILMGDVADVEVTEAIEYSKSLVSDEGKVAIAASHIMHYIHTKRLEKAITIFDNYKSSYGLKGDMAIVQDLITKASK